MRMDCCKRIEFKSVFAGETIQLDHSSGNVSTARQMMCGLFRMYGRLWEQAGCRRVIVGISTTLIGNMKNVRWHGSNI